jgi:hypothetical protein
MSPLSLSNTKDVSSYESHFNLLSMAYLLRTKALILSTPNSQNSKEHLSFFFFSKSLTMPKKIDSKVEGIVLGLSGGGIGQRSLVRYLESQNIPLSRGEAQNI